MTVKRYSKGSGFYFDSKKFFFDSNQQLLDEATEYNRFYAQQPRRLKCKLCDAELGKRYDFKSHGIEYTFCPSCTHLNGAYEDTLTFVEKIYFSNAGADYARDYVEGEYTKRVDDIYLPKVDFLLQNKPPGVDSILDVGCGSGYFVYACLLRSLKATGIDVNQAMIQFGNAHISCLLNSEPLVQTSESTFFDHVSQTDASLVSAIGVIEHLRQPHLLFDAFGKSKAKYLYYSVPMFSLSALVENVFPDIYPRQLSGAHTHLFTESSISKMNAICEVEPIAEWRFGTDVMDFYRSLMVALAKKGGSAKLLTIFKERFSASIDELQATLDKSHFCSEIHCLTQKV